MKVYLGSDHAGFELKKALAEYVATLGHDVLDLGAHEYDENDDYPDFVVPVAKLVAEDPQARRGIVIGGSGQGEAMAANRVHGARAVVFNGQYEPVDGREVPHEIILSRQHNDANILSLGARFLSVDDARDAVKVWLETPFSEDERHIRRLDKIEQLTR